MQLIESKHVYMPSASSAAASGSVRSAAADVDDVVDFTVPQSDKQTESAADGKRSAAAADLFSFASSAAAPPPVSEVSRSRPSSGPVCLLLDKPGVGPAGLSLLVKSHRGHRPSHGKSQSSSDSETDDDEYSDEESESKSDDGNQSEAKPADGKDDNNDDEREADGGAGWSGEGR